MDPNFSALLGQWTNFYEIAATGAATFSGLLFVGISINVDVISREEKRILRTGAQMIFDLFLTVFFVDLLLLLPDLSPLVAAWIIAGGGVLGLGLPAVELLRRWRSPAPSALPTQLVLPLLTPVVLDLILIRQGVAIGAGDTTALVLLPVVLVVILVAALILSWRLLIDVARVKPHLAAQDRNADRDRGTERQIRNLVRELRAQNRRLHETEHSAPPPLPRERAGRK